MDSTLLTLGDQVAAKHTALLVVDMQNDFCARDGYLDRKSRIDVQSRQEVASKIMELATSARQGGAPVIWIVAIYDLELLSAAHCARAARLSGGEALCAEGSWGADFFEAVAPARGELVIRKHRYSAFNGTNLAAELHSRAIHTLIVTGVATNVCVDSTLRDGFFEGFHIVVPQDCVAADDRALHEATLSTIERSFGYVTDSETLVGLLTR